MLKDLLRYRVNAVALGGVLLTIFLVGLGVAYMINRSFTLTFWDRGYELKADFVDADGIANASDIRVNGVYVGQVTQIRAIKGGLAEITFRVDPAHSPLHVGTHAQLRLQTLLGTKFIELTPGDPKGDMLAANSVIPADKTQSPVDFDQWLSQFDAPTRKSVSQIVTEAGTATNQRGQDINMLLGELDQLSVQSGPDLQVFADRHANLDGILVHLAGAGETLAADRVHLANTQTQLNSILGTIAANDTGFRGFIHNGNVAEGHGLAQIQGESTNFQALIQQFRGTLDRLSPTLVNINQAAVNLDPFIKISEPLVHNTLRYVEGYNANTANTSNCTQAPGATPAGCGGIYLRQPTVLAQFGHNAEVAPPSGGAATHAQPVDTNPLVPLPPVPVIPPLPLPVPLPSLPPLPLPSTVPVPSNPVPVPSPVPLPSPPCLPPLCTHSATGGSAASTSNAAPTQPTQSDRSFAENAWLTYLFGN